MRKWKRQFTLSEGPESLERRSMLAANVLDVTKVLWNGQQVNAVRNEYVVRMPQTNAAVARSPLDYACKVPTIQSGWSVQSLGAGFFKLTAPGATQASLTTWASRNGVQSIDVNRVAKASLVPNDPLFGDLANWAFPKISAANAWDTGTGTSSTIVAVLDSGVDYNHPDLAANMWKNPNEIPGDGRDNDNNGYVDDVFGINAIAGTVDPMDDFGHGTLIAGLVGAVGNNAVGMTGVNWACKVMAVKVMDAAGNVPLNAEIIGINYVIRQKLAGQSVAVANCSFGRNDFNQQEFDALNQLALTGVSIVAAAGNDANDNDVNPVYPANYAIDGLISVAASDRNDNLAPFSNFGATTVDLAAPGVGILSTRAAQANSGLYPPYQGNNYTVSNNGFTQNQAFVDGTSASAAIVSGSAALLKSLKPGASAVQIKNAILNSVDASAGLAGRVLTGGRLNLQNAVNQVLATTGAVPEATFVIGQNLRYLEGNVGYAMAEVKVRLDRPCDPGKSCAVFYTTQPGGSAVANVDYVPTSGFLTFSGSEMEKSFYVRLIGDRQAEQDEQFAVQIIAARSRGVTTGGALQQVNIVILDDDNTTAPVQPGPTNAGLQPQISIDVKRDAAGVALPIFEGNTATFVVSLDKTSTKPISVKYRTNQPSLVPVNTALEGVDYMATSGTLTFKPGERTKEFTVRILSDSVTNEGIDLNNDGDVRDAGEGEVFHVVLTEPLNADLAPATGGGGGGGGVNTSAAVSARIIDAFVPPPAPGFQITLNYLGNVPASIRGAAEWAAARWSQVITADLPDVVDPETGTVIDDILIDVQAGLLDGAGTDGTGGLLANAGPEAYRATGTRLPWKASAGIDPADANNPLLRQIVLHEFGHALGFVSEVFQQKNLLNAAGSGWIGANALREYRSIFGVRNALNVPMEAGGGAGTAGSHWSESIFGNELMTGYVSNASSLPLSRITVGAMADLGYTVNYARADAYTKPVATQVAATPNSGTPLRAIVLAPVANRHKLASLAAVASASPLSQAVSGAAPSAPARRAAFGLIGRS